MVVSRRSHRVPDHVEQTSRRAARVIEDVNKGGGAIDGYDVRAASKAVFNLERIPRGFCFILSNAEAILARVPLGRTIHQTRLPTADI